MTTYPTHWKRSWPVSTVLAFVVAFELVVAVVSIDLLASVRAYVTGESLYSKGQKDAQIYLLDYAQGQREEDYQRFLGALAVPLGDRKAREELEKASPDLAVARAGFLSGGNHPDDVDGLIRLFRWFHRVPFMAEPISIWREGDLVIEKMQALVKRARVSRVAPNAGVDEFRELREQAPLLNSRLTELESSFSAQLGKASRQTQRLLIAVNVVIATVLALTGFGFIRRSTRIQVATEGEVRRRQQSLQRLLDSAAEGVFGVDMEGRCTFVNRAALEILGYERKPTFWVRKCMLWSTTRMPTAARIRRASRGCTRPFANVRNCTSQTRCSGAATARRCRSNTGRTRSCRMTRSRARSRPSSTSANGSVCRPRCGKANCE